MKEEQKLITIGQYESGFEAKQVKIALEDEGIEAVVLGDNLGAGIPYSARNDYIELQVFEKDIERAEQILDEMEKLKGSEDQDDEEEDL